MIAIIGLGGTGGYVLDFMIKTPVREIRGFDADGYHVHNSYRSPGRLDVGELGRPKAEVYAQRYGNFREGLKLETKFIDANSGADLDRVTFAFVCVDRVLPAMIIDLLITKAFLSSTWVWACLGRADHQGKHAGDTAKGCAADIRAMNLVPTPTPGTISTRRTSRSRS